MARAWIALALLCLLLGAFLEVPELMETPGSDTGMFATYGTMLLHGARPYVDFWDLHPPLIFAYWALVQAVAGPDWVGSCWPNVALAIPSCTGLVAHGLDLLLSVAAALACAALTRSAGGSAVAAGVAALLVVGFSDQAMLSQEGSNPSKLTLVPSVVAVWLYVGSLNEVGGARRAVLAGVAAALAGLAKQPALLTLVALAGHAVWRRDGQRLFAVLVGAGVSLLVACTALMVVGSFDGFVAQVWVYNVERVFVGYFIHPAKAPVIGLDRVLAESAGTLALTAAVGAVGLARAVRDPRRSAILSWAGVNLVAVVIFREFVYEVPSLAVVGALGIEPLWRWRGLRQPVLARGLVLVACAVGLVLTTGFQRTQLARAAYERGSGQPYTLTEELGQIVQRDLPPGPLFVYGNGAQLYVLSNRLPATPYLNAEALRSTAPGAPNTREQLVSMLRKRPPPVVVLAPHSDEAELTLEDYPSMRELLADCYLPKPIKAEIDTSWTVLTRSGLCGPS